MEPPRTVTEILALERTELANERTLLAWLRTGLGFAGAGGTLLHVGETPALHVLGGVLLAAGIGLSILGIARTARTGIRHRRAREAAEGSP